MLHPWGGKGGCRSVSALVRVFHQLSRVIRCAWWSLTLGTVFSINLVWQEPGPALESCTRLGTDVSLWPSQRFEGCGSAPAGAGTLCSPEPSSPRESSHLLPWALLSGSCPHLLLSEQGGWVWESHSSLGPDSHLAPSWQLLALACREGMGVSWADGCLQQLQSCST